MERKPDTQYRELLRRILSDGEFVESQQGENAMRVIGHMLRFDLRDGTFPMITERDLLSDGKKTKSTFFQALGELFGFLNGAHTQEELEKFGCGWWRPWVTAEKCAKRGLAPGDLGPGSYGPAWTAFPTAEGISFDQIQAILKQIKELPHLRTHFISPWAPQYIIRGQDITQKVVVVPCHGWLHILINTNTGELSLHHFQRSADVPVGLVANLIQYGALTYMLAQVTGYRVKELVYTLSDAHIFQRQLPEVEAMLDTKPQPLPRLTVDPAVKDLRQFRQEHFTVHDYFPQQERKIIPTPV